MLVGGGAEAQIAAIASWWASNRPDAPDAFLDELDAAFDRLAEQPQVGVRYPATRPAHVRRILLQKSRHHIYYTVHPDSAQVRIRAVWHASRGSKPRLGSGRLDDP